MSQAAGPGRTPFRIRAYRLQWSADLAASWAFEMESLILAWFILVETGSVMLLSLFASMQFFGTLFAPMFGVAGDRIGARNLLCLMRATYLLLATTLTVLALAGALGPWQVFVIAGLMGLVRPSDTVMRNALIGATVPAQQFTATMGLSHTTHDSARIAGALSGAGLVAALGLGVTYVVVTLLYAVSLVLTSRIAADRPRPHAAGKARPSQWRELRDAAVYVGRTPHLAAGLWIAFLANATAFPFMIGLMPYVTREVFGADQTVLGYLVASVGFGALLGSIALGRFGGSIRSGRAMLVAPVVWYLLLIVFVHAPGPLAAVPILMLAGFAQAFSLIPLSAMMLRSSTEAMRGRVMGLRMLAVYGLSIGLVLAGPLIARFGYRPVGLGYCVAGLMVMAWIALRWRATIWPAGAPANVR